MMLKNSKQAFTCVTTYAHRSCSQFTVIIIVYQVPFASLADEEGTFLSDKFRIRIVPSLTTLQLVQDSLPDYHIPSEALIVGYPVVSGVLYKGRRKNITALPRTRKEAAMMGGLLGVTPWIGEAATKHDVLQAIKSVSLIQIAAHGDAERGKMALSP